MFESIDSYCTFGHIFWYCCCHISSALKSEKKLNIMIVLRKQDDMQSRRPKTRTLDRFLEQKIALKPKLAKLQREIKKRNLICDQLCLKIFLCQKVFCSNFRALLCISFIGGRHYCSLTIFISKRRGFFEFLK